jgi:hypothetical protein
VVSASATLADTAGWTTAQQAMAAFSDNTDHRIVTSTHGGLLDHPRQLR